MPDENTEEPKGYRKIPREEVGERQHRDHTRLFSKNADVNPSDANKDKKGYRKLNKTKAELGQRLIRDHSKTAKKITDIRSDNIDEASKAGKVLYQKKLDKSERKDQLHSQKEYTEAELEEFKRIISEEKKVKDINYLVLHKYLVGFIKPLRDDQHRAFEYHREKDLITRDPEKLNKAINYYFEHSFQDIIGKKHDYSLTKTDEQFIDYLNKIIEESLDKNINRKDRDFVNKIVSGKLDRLLSKENENQLKELWKRFTNEYVQNLGDKGKT
jgi:hypothetical protein